MHRNVDPNTNSEASREAEEDRRKLQALRESLSTQLPFPIDKEDKLYFQKMNGAREDYPDRVLALGRFLNELSELLHLGYSNEFKKLFFCPKLLTLCVKRGDNHPLCFALEAQNRYSLTNEGKASFQFIVVHGPNILTFYGELSLLLPTTAFSHISATMHFVPYSQTAFKTLRYVDGSWTMRLGTVDIEHVPLEYMRFEKETVLVVLNPNIKLDMPNTPEPRGRLISQMPWTHESRLSLPLSELRKQPKKFYLGTEVQDPRPMHFESFHRLLRNLQDGKRPEIITLEEARHVKHSGNSQPAFNEIVYEGDIKSQIVFRIDRSKSSQPDGYSVYTAHCKKIKLFLCDKMELCLNSTVLLLIIHKRTLSIVIRSNSLPILIFMTEAGWMISYTVKQLVECFVLVAVQKEESDPNNLVLLFQPTGKDMQPRGEWSNPLTAGVREQVSQYSVPVSDMVLDVSDMVSDVSDAYADCGSPRPKHEEVEDGSARPEHEEEVEEAIGAGGSIERLPDSIERPPFSPDPSSHGFQPSAPPLEDLLASHVTAQDVAPLVASHVTAQIVPLPAQRPTQHNKCVIS